MRIKLWRNLASMLVAALHRPPVHNFHCKLDKWDLNSTSSNQINLKIKFNCVFESSYWIHLAKIWQNIASKLAQPFQLFRLHMFVFKIFLLWVVSKSVFRSWRFSQLLIRSKLAVANKILVQVGVNVRPEFRLRRKWWYNGGKDFGHECIRYMPRILSKSKSVRWTQRFDRFFLSFIKRVLLAFDFSAHLQ